MNLLQMKAGFLSICILQVVSNAICIFIIMYFNVGQQSNVMHFDLLKSEALPSYRTIMLTMLGNVTSDYIHCLICPLSCVLCSLSFLFARMCTMRFQFLCIRTEPRLTVLHILCVGRTFLWYIQKGPIKTLEVGKSTQK